MIAFMITLCRPGVNNSLRGNLLMWIDGNVKLDLDGRLPAQEAVKIASSIYDGQD